MQPLRVLHTLAWQVRVREADMQEIAAQLKGVMASLADVERIAGALQADTTASRKVLPASQST